VPVYLDCNATTPMEPEVQDAVIAAFTQGPANAGSRTHVFGTQAKHEVERARASVAALVSAEPDEVVFTSGATEANNLAILGLAAHGLSSGRRHVISTTIEHKAVLEPLQALAERGFEVELVPPTVGGWVDPAAIEQALRPDTLLVSVMHVNNETGVIQPIPEIACLLERHSAYLHVDAAQGFGKRVGDLKNPRIDLMSISAHKIYGPQGVGALVARRRQFRRPPLQPLGFGGGQERGLRPGTLPVPLIIGLGRAAELAASQHQRRAASCLSFRQQAWDALLPLQPVLHGDPERMIPHVLNVSFPGVDAEALMLSLKHLVAVSNGSACTSASYKPSHVLTAMRVPDEEIAGSIRISWSHLTEHPDWDQVVEVVRRLQPAEMATTIH
jgi:cysteine desulfurase